MTNNWDKIIEKYELANFLQSPKYGKMNEILGDKMIVSDFDGKGWGMMIVRNAKRGRYLEIPCGPLTDWQNSDTLKAIFKEIKTVGQKEKCVFVRIRPQLLNTPENMKILSDLGLKKAPMHLAAEHTVIMDLTKSEEQLMKEMRRQTRYEVRRAEKLGIKVTDANTEEIFREFRQVQAETAKRQNFVPPSLNTLLAEREAFGDDIKIYRAETAEGESIAYGMIIKCGKEGDYYEAASTDLNRKLPGAYARLWQAAKDLKAE